MERARRPQAALSPEHRRGPRDGGRGRISRGRNVGAAPLQQQRRPSRVPARREPGPHASRHHVAERLNPRRVYRCDGVGQKGQQLRGVGGRHLAAGPDQTPTAVRDRRGDCSRLAGAREGRAEKVDAIFSGDDTKHTDNRTNDSLFLRCDACNTSKHGCRRRRHIVSYLRRRPS